MVSVLASGSSGLGSSTGLGHFLVFFPLTVPLFTQVCNCTSEFNAGSNPAIDWHPIQGAVEIL